MCCSKRNAPTEKTTNKSPLAKFGYFELISRPLIIAQKFSLKFKNGLKKKFAGNLFGKATIILRFVAENTVGR